MVKYHSDIRALAWCRGRQIMYVTVFLPSENFFLNGLNCKAISIQWSNAGLHIVHKNYQTISVITCKGQENNEIKEQLLHSSCKLSLHLKGLLFIFLRGEGLNKRLSSHIKAL